MPRSSPPPNRVLVIVAHHSTMSRLATEGPDEERG